MKSLCYFVFNHSVFLCPNLYSINLHSSLTTRSILVLVLSTAEPSWTLFRDGFMSLTHGYGRNSDLTKYFLSNHKIFEPLKLINVETWIRSINNLETIRLRKTRKCNMPREIRCLGLNEFYQDLPDKNGLRVNHFLSSSFFFYSCCSTRSTRHRETLVSLQFLNIRQSVGLLGRVISPLQGPYLTQTE
jgi:hypothetical protein